MSDEGTTMGNIGERSPDAVNGGGDRIDELIARVEYAAETSDTAVVEVRRLREVVGASSTGPDDPGSGLVAAVDRLTTAVGRWPKDPDDAGSGLLGRVARGSLTNEAGLLPPQGGQDAPARTMFPPAVAKFLGRWKKPISFVVAILAVLATIGQALQGF